MSKIPVALTLLCVLVSTGHVVADDITARRRGHDTFVVYRPASSAGTPNPDGTTTYILPLDIRNVTYAAGLAEIQLVLKFRNPFEAIPEALTSPSCGIEVVQDGNVVSFPGTRFVIQEDGATLRAVDLFIEGSPSRRTFGPVPLLGRQWRLRVAGNRPLSYIEPTLTWTEVDGDGTGIRAPGQLLAVRQGDLSALDNEIHNLQMTGSSVLSGTDKIIVVVHGWNPGGNRNPYAPSKKPTDISAQDDSNDGLGWRNLVKNLVQNDAILQHDGGQSWVVARYSWAADAATGSLNPLDGLSVRLGAAGSARDMAVIHGAELWERLRAVLRTPTVERPTRIHFIAHSAGNWVARRAAAFIKETWGRNAIVQLTALDPYVDKRFAGADRDLLPGFQVMTERLPASGARWFDLLENYYAVDADSLDDTETLSLGTSGGEDAHGATSGKFGWPSERNIVSAPLLEELSGANGTHARPVTWYAYTTKDQGRLWGGQVYDTVRGFWTSLAAREWMDIGLVQEGSKSPFVDISAVRTGGSIGNLGLNSIDAYLDGVKVRSLTLDFSSFVWDNVRGRGAYPLSLGRLSAGVHQLNLAGRVRIPGRDDSYQVQVGSSFSYAATNALNAPPSPSSLVQVEAGGGGVNITGGGKTSVRSVQFRAIVSDQDGDQVKLEVEVSRNGGAFSSSQVSSGGYVPSGGTASATAQGLPDGNYQWRARTRDVTDLPSASLVSFGGSDSGTPDFVVDTTPPPVVGTPGTAGPSPLAVGNQVLSLYNNVSVRSSAGGTGFRGNAPATGPGKIVSGPSSAQLYGTGDYLLWWEIDWSASRAGLKGWSAERAATGRQLLKKYEAPTVVTPQVVRPAQTVASGNSRTVQLPSVSPGQTVQVTLERRDGTSIQVQPTQGGQTASVLLSDLDAGAVLRTRVTDSGGGNGSVVDTPVTVAPSNCTPPGPMKLEVQDISDSGYTLHWIGQFGVPEFEVQATPASNPDAWATVSHTFGRTYTVAQAPTGSRSYRVRALDSFCSIPGEWSNVVTPNQATLSAGDITPVEPVSGPPGVVGTVTMRATVQRAFLAGTTYGIFLAEAGMSLYDSSNRKTMGGSGPGVTIAALTPGRTYNWGVEVLQPDGATFRSPPFSFQTKPGFNPPKVELAGSTDTTGDTISLVGFAYDPDPDDQLTYSWTVINSPPESHPTLVNQNSTNAGLTLDMVGEYTVRFTAVDLAGNAASAVLKATRLEEIPGLAEWRRETPASSPTPRYGHSMVYDSERKQIVLFGGDAGTSTDDNTNFLDDTWVWQGSNWTLQSPTSRPPHRKFASMAYDPVRRKIVLFGGVGKGSTPSSYKYLNDTWLWENGNWVQASPATLPSGRDGHAIAWDAINNRILMFGGEGATELSDTWAFDGENWTELFPSTKPSARYFHAMSLDAARNEVLLQGGNGPSDSSGGSGFRETWAWNGANWRLVASGDVGGRLQTMGYNPIRKCMFYAVGGGQEWYGTSWSQRAFGGTSPGLEGYSMVLDEASEKFVYFGGRGLPVNGNFQVFSATYTVPANSRQRTQISGPSVTLFGAPSRLYARVFEGDLRTNSGLDPTIELTWSRTGGSAPSADIVTGPTRNIATITPTGLGTYEIQAVARDEFQSGVPGNIVMNVVGGDSPLASTQRAWREIVPTTSPVGFADYWHGWVAYDSKRSRAVAYASNLSVNPYDIIWEWDGTSWEKRATTGGPPASANHGMAYDEARGETILFGGFPFSGLNSGQQGSVTWLWNGTSWRRAGQDVTQPTVRTSPVMAYDASRRKVVLFGGFIAYPDESRLETWEWDGSSWRNATPSTGERPFSSMVWPSPAMVYDSHLQRVVMVGARFGQPLQTWLWNGASWTRVLTAATPPGRAYPCLSYDPVREVVILHGGDGVYTDTWEFDGTNWSPIGLTSKIPTGYQRGAFYDLTRQSMVVVGGARGVTDEAPGLWELPSSGNGGISSIPRPAFSVSSSTPLAGTTVVFDASASVDRSSVPTVLTYRWDFDGDGRFDTSGGVGPIASRIYPVPGLYTVTLSASGRNDRTAVTTQSVAVLERPLIRPDVVFPADGSIGQRLDVVLQWQDSRPYAQANVSYDVAFGRQYPPDVVMYGTRETTLTVGPLEANTVYFAQVTARTEGGQSVAGPLATFVTGSPPVIYASPQSLTAAEHFPAVLSVFSVGTPPFSYKWYRAGVEMSGQTSSTLRIPAVSASDAGQYSVRVTALGQTSESETATLTVVPYSAPPAVSQVAATETATGVAVRWQLPPSEEIARVTVVRQVVGTKGTGLVGVDTVGDVVFQGLDTGFVDTTAPAGSEVVYRVIVEDQVGLRSQAVVSAPVGASVQTQRITLRRGLNLVNLTVLGPGNSSAEDLGTAASSIYVGRLDPTSRRNFQLHFTGGAGDFPLQYGEGYLLVSTSDRELEWRGSPASPSAKTVTLPRGLSLSGFPGGFGGQSWTAAQLFFGPLAGDATYIGRISLVPSPHWELYGGGGSDPNFVLQEGEAYLILLPAESTVSFSR